MSPEMNPVPNTIFSPELAARFDKLVTLYPVRRSALIPMLLYAQDEVGAVNDAVIAEIARRIEISELDVLIDVGGALAPAAGNEFDFVGMGDELGHQRLLAFCR